jgi:hypothetical protein
MYRIASRRCGEAIERTDEIIFRRNRQFRLEGFPPAAVCTRSIN